MAAAAVVVGVWWSWSWSKRRDSQTRLLASGSTGAERRVRGNREIRRHTSWLGLAGWLVGWTGGRTVGPRVLRSGLRHGLSQRACHRCPSAAHVLRFPRHARTEAANAASRLKGLRWFRVASRVRKKVVKVGMKPLDGLPLFLNPTSGPARRCLCSLKGQPQRLGNTRIRMR